MSQYIWLVVTFPLFGFLILGFAGKKLGEKLSGLIASIASSLSFVLAVSIFLEMLGKEEGARREIVNLFDWIVVGSIKASVAYQIDPLSMLMTLIITGIGSLIHFYSIGYMHGDKAVPRFFAYLNLFLFSMLNLVLGANLLLMFLGWEGVGLCSYLLIGYYYTVKDAGDAGKKAFIVNRVGDFGFLIGIFLIIQHFGVIDFASINELAGNFAKGDTIIFWITLMLFVGATGKSAQIPLYVWLPDAMAGPTPVSALIHAATMVTSGLYMLARLSPVYALAPDTLMIIAVIGAATAFFAATIGTQQNDIKKVLAYSTVSQLGYMFMGAGVGAFSAGIFHVMTHAFFKALLFLGAGSVIHALHHEQDMRNMGGLRKKLPITHLTFLIGTLAIAGTPLFSGFFSKDEILWKAFNFSTPIWFLGAAGAAITAYYMFRLYFVTFWGDMRYHEHGDHKVHESPLVMTIPLMVLAFLSVFGGFLGMPHVLDVMHVGNILEEFLHHTVVDASVVTYGHETEWTMMGVSVSVAFVGFLIAYLMFLKKGAIPKEDSQYSGLSKLVYNKYLIDELYDLLFVKSIFNASKAIWRWFDVAVIDGIVNGTGRLLRVAGEGVRGMQTGIVHDYMFSMLTGFVALFLMLYLYFI